MTADRRRRLPASVGLDAGEVRYFVINDQDIESDTFQAKTTYHKFDLLVGATYF